MTPSGGTSATYPNLTGQEITVAILGGQQPAVFTAEADRFTELTGLKINLVDMAFGDLYPKMLTELRSGSGAFDIVSPPQYFVGDFAQYLEPLDSYMAAAPIEDFEDILPNFRNLAKQNGQNYCMTTDGDVWSLYYRLSAFNDAKNQADFKAKSGRELTVPKTWDEFNEVAAFFTKGDQYGTAMMIAPVFFGSEFAQRFYSYGGKWFDPNTMDAKVNGTAGVQALKSVIGTVKASPPGVLNYGFTETDDDFAQGRLPMIIQWGDTGGHTGDAARSAAGVRGDVGYAPVPGAKLDGQLHQPQLLAWGFCAAVAKDSQHKEAAYQFLRFFTSKDAGAREVDQHKGLDPYRESYFARTEAVGQFPNADKWLAQTLLNQKAGVPDLRIPGAKQYYDAIASTIGDALAQNLGNLDAIDAQGVMNTVAEKMNALTDELGRDQQKQAYVGTMEADPAYAALPGD